MHELLKPLSPDQQRLVDLVAEAFLLSEHEWPFFDYVEGILDGEGKDAWEILQTFPEMGRWRYCAVTWVHGSPTVKPSAEAEIGLSVVGMSHSPALCEYVSVFFALVDFLAERRRQIRPQPRKARSLDVTSDEFAQHWRAGRHLDIAPRLTHQLGEHEPPTRWGGGSFQPETGTWTRSVSRELLDFAGLRDVADYVSRLDRFLLEPATSVPPLVSSPLSLVAALDYLDAVWRLTHDRQRLFALASAERTTRLAFDLQTADEFAAHVSALGEILRSANHRAKTDAPRSHRDRPLARLEADIVQRVGADARTRVSDAVRVLEEVVALRDARQHGEASDRGIAAFRNLGIPYPPANWHGTWQAVSGRAIDALNSLREELDATLTDE